jgi:hypothetical protein
VAALSVLGIRPLAPQAAAAKRPWPGEVVLNPLLCSMGAFHGIGGRVPLPLDPSVCLFL